MNVFFLLHEQTVDFRLEPAYTELVKPFLCSGHVKSHSYCVYQRDFRRLRARLIEKRIHDVAQHLGRRPVVIYGAGELTRQIWPRLTRRLNISAVADRDYRSEEKRSFGVPLIPAERISDHAGCVLICALASQDEIERDLLKQRTLEVISIYTRKQLEHSVHRPLEAAIMEKIRSCRPDLIVWALTFAGENLRGRLFQKIRSNFPEIKLYTQWWDYNDALPELVRLEKESLKYSHMVGIIDSYSRFAKIRDRSGSYHDYPDVHKLCWHPTLFDPDLYRRKRLPKLFDIAIIGSAEGQRVDYIRFLQETFKERFHHFGGIRQPGQAVDRQRYVELMNQTRICVNTQTSPERVQLKGRVREALCLGAFLLEADNPETRSFVPEGKGLVFFDSHDELKSKVDHYLGADREREQIADDGYNWYHARFSANRWVGTIIHHCGL